MGLRRNSQMNLQVHFGSFRFWLRRLCGWCCSLRWGLGQSSRLAEGGQWRCGALDVLSLRCLDIRGEIVGLTVWSFREWPDGRVRVVDGSGY